MSKYPKMWPVGGHPEGEAKVRQLQKLGPKWLRSSGVGWVAEKQSHLSNVKYGENPPYVIIDWMENGGLYDSGALTQGYVHHWIVLDSETLSIKKRGSYDYGVHGFFSRIGAGYFSSLGTKLGKVFSVSSPSNESIGGVSGEEPALATSKDGVVKYAFENPPGDTAFNVDTPKIFETNQAQYLSFNRYRRKPSGELAHGFARWSRSNGELDTDGVLRMPSPEQVLVDGMGTPLRASDYALGVAAALVGGATTLGGASYGLGWYDATTGQLTGSRVESLPPPSPGGAPFIGWAPEKLCAGNGRAIEVDNEQVRWGAVIEVERWQSWAGVNWQDVKYRITLANMFALDGSRLNTVFGEEIAIDRTEYFARPMAVCAVPKGVLVLLHTTAFENYALRDPQNTPMPEFHLALYSVKSGELVKTKKIAPRPKDYDGPPAVYLGVNSFTLQPNMHTIWP